MDIIAGRIPSVSSGHLVGKLPAYATSFRFGLSPARCQPHQQVHAESVDYASLQIRHTCLESLPALWQLLLASSGYFPAIAPNPSVVARAFPARPLFRLEKDHKIRYAPPVSGRRCASM